MRFARVVFFIAGVYGLLVLAPLYFVFDLVGRQTPPPVTHPEFYYGFVGVGLVWQVAFLMIATDPRRFRPMIIVSALEKASYVIAVAVLYLQHRIAQRILASAMGDAILAVLFIAAFFMTRPASMKRQRDRRAALTQFEPDGVAAGLNRPCGSTTYISPRVMVDCLGKL